MLPGPLCAAHSLATWRTAATFGTPRPIPPTGTASVPSRSSSAVGRARVPSLSFSRRTRIPFQAPSGWRRLSANSESPRLPGSVAPSGRARATATSAVVADVNHFVPRRR